MSLMYQLQWGAYSDTSVLSPLHLPSLIQQVKKFTSCLLFAVKNEQTLTLGTPPKYMVVTRELKFIFLPTLTCSQCGTGYYFMCIVFSKIWILTPLMWNCPLAKQKPVQNSTIAQSFHKGEKASEEKQRKDVAAKTNTPYLIAKEELPFRKFEPLLALQRKNGLEISPTYTNDKGCNNLVSLISSVITEQLAREINGKNYVSVMIDGATDASGKENKKCPLQIFQGREAYKSTSRTQGSGPCTCRD